MKRKFSLNLAPIRTQLTRSDARSSPLSSRTDESTPISPPLSPINRRPLSAKTEAQLRAACAAIYHSEHLDESAAGAGIIPEAHLNFAALHRLTKEKRAEEEPESSRHYHRRHHSGGREPRAPSGLPDLHSREAPRHYAYKPDSALDHLFAPGDIPFPTVQQEANTSRRRNGSHSQVQEYGQVAAHSQHGRPRAYSRKDSKQEYSYSKPRPPPRTEGSIDTNLSTPVTSSDHYGNTNSTAPTSVQATSPPYHSRRDSRQAAHGAAVQRADVTAQDWMRREFEKRRKDSDSFDLPIQKHPSETRKESMDIPKHSMDVQKRSMDLPKPLREPKTAPQEQRMSRARSRSVKEGLRDYFRPGTSKKSRNASRERAGKSVPESPTGESAPGWRSWGIARRTSAVSLRRGSTSASRTRKSSDAAGPKSPSQINPNKELPPLPSLDMWQKEQEVKDKSALPHIADVMRSRSASQQQHPRAMAMDALVQRASSASHNDPLAAVSSRKKKAHRRSSSVPEVGGLQITSKDNARISSGLPAHDFDALMSAIDHPSTETKMKELKSYRHQPSMSKDSNNSHQTSQSDVTSPSAPSLESRPSFKVSIDATQTPPNFSRKMSLDTSTLRRKDKDKDKDKERDMNDNLYNDRDRDQEPRFPNVVEMTDDGPRLDKDRKGLRKYFSAWAVKGGKKNNNWMDRIEKEGVKSGVMIEDGAACAPFIRY